METLRYAVLEGAREVLSHKTRSFIAVLALVCGVGSLLATFALTDGVAASEKAFLTSWGGVEKMYVEDKPLPPQQESRRGLSPGKTLYDVRAIQRSATLVRFCAPQSNVIPAPTVTRGRKEGNGYWVFMATPDLFPASRFDVEFGRALTDLDLQQRARVCVLGAGAAKALGISKADLGTAIRISGENFTVVGILKQTEVWSKNLATVVPVTTAQSMFCTAATETTPELNQNLMFRRIAVQVCSVEYLDAAIDQIRAILRQTHRGLNDCGFNSLQDWAEAIDGRIAATKLTGSLTALVSLFVGSVGITNVMLASVRQRMREIGIRRAVGATSRSIFIQILSETAMLSIFGGIIGLGAGAGLLKVLSIGIKEAAAPVLSPASWWISFGAALLAGLLAGIYPACRGAAITPNEALRYE